jgi:anti-sigma-K factor RskA
MNIHEYIASGIVESYVLGLASPEERIEFEQMCAQYPELVEARNNFELSLEEQARRNVLQPPVGAKEKAWNAIQQTSASSGAKLISMQQPTSRSGGLRWVAAASIILLLITGYLAATFYNQTKELKNSNNELRARVNTTDSILNRLAEAQRIVSDPKVTVVNLSALKKSNNAPSASVYWDSTSSNVYLLIKNMPKLATDKQYQLWSIIDSAGKMKPTSLGLFEGGTEKIMLKMDKAQKADAFAITIENRGNLGGPNLDQLQVMGKAKL